MTRLISSNAHSVVRCPLCSPPPCECHGPAFHHLPASLHLVGGVYRTPDSRRIGEGPRAAWHLIERRLPSTRPNQRASRAMVYPKFSVNGGALRSSASLVCSCPATHAITIYKDALATRGLPSHQAGVSFRFRSVFSKADQLRGRSTFISLFYVQIRQIFFFQYKKMSAIECKNNCWKNLGRALNTPFIHFTRTKAVIPGRRVPLHIVYMEWVGAYPFPVHSPDPAAVHTPEVCLLENEASRAFVLIWPLNLSLRNSSNSVKTCECLRCGRPSSTERKAAFYCASTSLKVNMKLHNGRIS